MKDIVKTVLDHPFASIFVILTIGQAIEMVAHGTATPIFQLNISRTTVQADT